MRIVLMLCLIAGVTLAASGAKTVQLTVYSDPAGATLYQDDQTFGYAPTTLKYPASKAFHDGTGCMALKPLRVRWASGAEASLPELQACPQKGAQQQLTFVRPAEVAGREFDVYFAAQVAALAQQNAADRQAAITAAWQAAAVSTYRFIPHPTPQHCISSLIGQQVYTNCF